MGMQRFLLYITQAVKWVSGMGYAVGVSLKTVIPRGIRIAYAMGFWLQTYCRISEVFQNIKGKNSFVTASAIERLVV